MSKTTRFIDACLWPNCSRDRAAVASFIEFAHELARAGDQSARLLVRLTITLRRSSGLGRRCSSFRRNRRPHGCGPAGRLGFRRQVRLAPTTAAPCFGDALVRRCAAARRRWRDQADLISNFPNLGVNAGCCCQSPHADQEGKRNVGAAICTAELIVGAPYGSRFFVPNRRRTLSGHTTSSR
jgi:hypothetical protein